MALIHRWKLDGNANDSVGAQNLIATSVSFPSYNRMSGNSYARMINNHGEILGSSINLPSYPSFSLTAWHNLYAGSSGDIINFGDGNSASWQLFTYTYNGIYYLYPGKFVSIATAEKTYLQDYLYKWVFISVVDVDGIISVYVNGVLRSTLNNPRNGSTTILTSIGSNTVGYGKYYSSSMVDDVRIYDTALTAAEVKSLYNSYFTEKSVSLAGFMM